jgi:hypothetical protein
MTFRESEFPDILNRIEEIIESQKDPMVAVQLIREMVENYKEIPLYPGIVNGVSYDLIESSKIEELEEGDYVAVEEEERHLTGQVQSIDDGTIKLSNAIECSWANETESDAEDIDAVQRFTLGALEREWPELIFEEDKGVNN